MQLALRDKEETLVQKALERIRRAQMLGKKNVKLTQPELDALERKRQKDQAIKHQANRKASHLNLGDERRRSSGQPSNTTKERHPTKSRSKGHLPGYDGEGLASSRRATPPGALIPGAGAGSFSNSGPHPSIQGRSSPSGSRSASSNSLAQYSPPMSRSNKKRLSSGTEPPTIESPRLPNTSRRLPDDADWIPRSRSTSSASGQYYPYDPYQYQTYSPPLPQAPIQYSNYGHSRRIVSSPQPGVQYPRIRGDPRSAEPSSLRTEHFGQDVHGQSDSADGSVSDDDEGDGVQVNVAPYSQDFSKTMRPESTIRERPRRGGR